MIIEKYFIYIISIRNLYLKREGSKINLICDNAYYSSSMAYYYKNFIRIRIVLFPIYFDTRKL